MKKIKILFEGLSPNLGGIEVFMHTLISNMDMKLYEVAILLEDNNTTPFLEEYIKKGIKVFRVTNKELKELYKNNDFDIIYINMVSYSLFERIRFACKYSKAKVILHSHSSGYTLSTGWYKIIILNKGGKCKS